MPSRSRVYSRRAALAVALALAFAPAAATAEPPGARRLVKAGVAIEFSLEGVGGGGSAPPMHGEEAEVRFTITDATTGAPIPGRMPAAWIDIEPADAERKDAASECREKVARYMKGTIGFRPMIDLNSYYLLVLNQDASISVIDPIVNMTGKTSLYATVVLRRPGADWARSVDHKRLFVSMPRAGEVAVVNTDAFKVHASVPAGKQPTRVALQPDGRYLWIGNDAAAATESGVTVLDAASLAVRGFVATGRGHHEIAFSKDSRVALVTNRDEGTVSLVDVEKLEEVKDLATGPLPISAGYSAAAEAFYVADGKEGTITVIDGARLEIVGRIAAKAGLGPMRFSVDGRYGFVVNTGARALHVFDATQNRMAHTLDIGGKPYQVAVTRAFAYVRLLDSDRVKLVNVATLGGARTPVVQEFQAGQGSPELAQEIGIADAVALAPVEAAVFVVNPADNTTSYYMEGMNAPMGSYGNYGHAARAVTVVDRSVTERSPGVYASRIRLPASGHYEIAFALDEPRVVTCFRADVAVNPALEEDHGPLAVEWVDFPVRAPAGARKALRLALSDPASRAPRAGLGDVTVLLYSTRGRERTVVAAREVGGGVYEAAAEFPRPGAWYVYVSVPSLGVKLGDLPFRAVRVEAAP